MRRKLSFETFFVPLIVVNIFDELIKNEIRLDFLLKWR
jgi:hypothetical protein